MRKVVELFESKLSGYLILFIIISGIYYKFFLFGRIPFPGDLLVGSYSPWFDYYKIPVQNPLISDVFSQLFLWKYLSIDIIKSGQWPLWNPFSFTGNPLLATYQSASLYPLNVLLFLPKYFGWGIFIFSQTLLGAFNMYLMLGLFVKSKLARLTGALVFATGGLMSTWVQQGIPVHGIIWLPLSLYLLEKFLRSKKLRYLIFLPISLSFAILAGHFQMILYSVLFILAYTLAKTFQKDLKNFLETSVPVFFSVLLGITLSSIQLLPSFDLFKKSIRLTENYTGEFGFGLLALGDFLKFFVADFFGNPVTRNYWGSLNYFETSSFIGTASLPLLIFAFCFLKKNFTSFFFLSAFIASVILTFHNPLSDWLYSLNIPFLTASFASRMLFISVFISAVLCALSLNQIVILKEKDKLFKSILYSLSGLSGVFIGSIFSRLYFQKILSALEQNISLAEFKQPFLRDSAGFFQNIDTSIRNTLLPLAIIMMLFFSYLILKRVKVSVKIQITLISFLVLTLLTFDLSRYFLKFNPFVPGDLIFPKVPAIEYLTKQPGLFRVAREHAEIFPPNTWTAYGLQSPEGYDPIYLNRYGEYMRFLNGGSLFEGRSSRYAEIASNYYSPYIDSANVKFFLALLRDKSGKIPGDELDWRFKESPYEMVFKDGSAAVLKNPNAMERVYFAQNLIFAPEREIKDIFATDKTFDPRVKTAISQDLDISKITGKGNAEILYYSPNEVRIKSNTSSEEILILTDQYDEGWKAYIDSAESIISPANLIFRAVKVPPGEHEVVFTYWPKSFDLGLKISLTSLVILALVGGLSIWVRKF